jgi:hypothetical protein
VKISCFSSVLVYPRCTNSTPAQPISDCGSRAWAYVLFIAWNVMSMVRSFIGSSIAARSFSFLVHFRQYVYWCGRRKFRVCHADDKLKKYWERGYEKFQKALGGICQQPQWATAAGSIHELFLCECDHSTRLLSAKYYTQRLAGKFDVRIYPTEYSVPNLIALARIDPSPFGQHPLSSSQSNPNIVSGLDLHTLRAALKQIDIHDTKMRRAIYNRLFQEAYYQSGAWPGGLTFTDTLLIVASNKLICRGLGIDAYT